MPKRDEITGRWIGSPLETQLVYSVAENGCWIMAPTQKLERYRTVYVKGKRIGAHRVAAHVWLGFDLSSPLQILHRCDNPKCINPDHLFPGTASDNTQDCVSKGRHGKQKKTHCPYGHPYSGENLANWIGNGRRCRICSRNSANRYYANKVGKEALVHA